MAKRGAGGRGGGAGAGSISVGRGLGGLVSKLVDASKSVASRVPGSPVSSAPKSLPPNPKIPKDVPTGGLYSRKPLSDRKIRQGYKDMREKGADDDLAINVLRTGTQLSPQPRTKSEIRKILGLREKR